MPWKEITPMTERRELVALGKQTQANISELCRRYRISRKTAYKWLNRAAKQEQNWEYDRSRRPHSTPGRIPHELEEAVLDVRDAHPAWGGRKIRKWMQEHSEYEPPAASTITAVMRRNGRLRPEDTSRVSPMQCFEREAPNELWQMDFKGPFHTAAAKCHPLTVVDDHSRFAVCVAACTDQRTASVKNALTEAFRIYGLPVSMLMDNGSCWKGTDSPYTALTAWLTRLGVRLCHGRPWHPQTQGKNERFNRTLKAEAIKGRLYLDFEDCQRGFDRFRACYNLERPHEALGMEVPAGRYRVSPFPFPEMLPPIEYLETDTVRRVGPAGYISYRKERFHVGRAFSGDPVGLRLTERDGVVAVYYCSLQVAEIDLKKRTCDQRGWEKVEVL